LASEYRELEQTYDEAFEIRRQAVLTMVSETDEEDWQEARAEFLNADERFSQTREQVKGLISEMNEDPRDETFNDTNYIFPTFVLTQLPAGFVGLILVAILAAAMSTVESELNSLSTATVVDFYRRYVTRDGSDRHYLMVSRISTLAWGGFATFCALYMGQLGSAIEAVNTIGSYFYGSILGVFVLAIAARRSNGHGAFWGVLVGFVAVLATAQLTDVSYLYYNIVGCVVAVAVGYAISLTTSNQAGSA
jgi:Na+/proline symporter